MAFHRIVPPSSRQVVAAGPRSTWRRARAIPATGMPGPRQRGRRWAIVSILAHAALLLLLVPRTEMNLDPDIVEMKDLGGGGPGPAGGGGGGTRGTGGVRWVELSPPPPAQAAPPPEPTPQPTLQPVIEPPKPIVPEPVLPQMELPKLAQMNPSDVKVSSPIVGTGGGTGNDGTSGNGPGSGGGVGSGIGTGRGSGVGPGTGGGNLDHYPPTPIEMFIPPMPIPDKVRGHKFIAEFDVDEKGRIIDVKFTPTKDGGYNKRLNEILRSFRFRPGTTLQGVPIRAKTQVTYEF